MCRMTVLSLMHLVTLRSVCLSLIPSQFLIFVSSAAQSGVVTRGLNISRSPEDRVQATRRHCKLFAEKYKKR